VSHTPFIRNATISDTGPITAIYNDAIDHTVASVWFDHRPVSELAERIESATELHPTLAAEIDGVVVGGAWAGPWNPRNGYDSTVEFTVYVDGSVRGRGVGKALYSELIRRVRAAGARDAIGGISLPNDASVRLHESLGFRHVGTFEGIAEKFGRCLDVGYWQLRL